MDATAAVKTGGPGTVYRCGTLTYTRAGLAALFAWLLWGDFCYTIMETVVPSVLPLKLKALDCPNWMMGMILTTIPGVLGMAVGPWVSFTSDRYRSRWGRRIPFIAWTLPLLCVSLALLGFSEEIAVQLRTHASFLQRFSPTATTIAVITVLLALFQFFNAFVNSVFWYLFNDVVPREFLARFLGLFRIVGTGAGALYNYAVFQYAGTHMREIFVGAALLYFIGFGLVCLRVREGEYPAAPNAEAANPMNGIRTFLTESFSGRFYWLVFLFSIFQNVATSSMGAFLVFFYLNMGLSLEQFGRLNAIGGVAGLLAMYLAATFIDRWHPLRVLTYTSVFTFLGYAMGLVWLFVTLPPVYFFWLSLGAALISVFQSALLGGCFLPCYMRVFPQSRFGQFCSAMSMIRTLVTIGTGMLAGLFIDYVKRACNGSDYAYRFIFVWFTVGSLVYIAFIIPTYREWHRLGGDARFNPPAPWDPRGFEESAPVSGVGPRERWLNLACLLFRATMALTVLGIVALMYWMDVRHAAQAWRLHAWGLLPLSVVGWLYWRFVERGIRADVGRVRSGERPRYGVPHHGVLLVTATQFLLALGLWLGQVIVSIRLNMEHAAVTFTAASVIGNIILAGSVHLLWWVERGYSETIDAPLPEAPGAMARPCNAG